MDPQAGASAASFGSDFRADERGATLGELAEPLREEASQGCIEMNEGLIDESNVWLNNKDECESGGLPLTVRKVANRGTHPGFQAAMIEYRIDVWLGAVRAIEIGEQRQILREGGVTVELQIARKIEAPEPLPAGAIFDPSGVGSLETRKDAEHG
jgi:hypothetical protein